MKQNSNRHLLMRRFCNTTFSLLPQKSIFVKLLVFTFITPSQRLIARDKETNKCTLRSYHTLLERN